MKRGLGFIALCALLLTALTAAQAQTPERSAPRIGVAAHLGGASRADSDRQVTLAANAGFRIVRWEIQWKYVEPSKGEFVWRSEWDYTVDRLHRAGLDSLLILDYGNPAYDGGDKPRSAEAIAAFARYASFMAEHLKGRVRYYQVWNEWNSGIGKTSKGNAADYVSLARATYRAIKKVDPEATVVIGGFSSASYDSLIGYGDRDRSFEDLLSYDLKDFGDVLAIHPYVVYKGAAWNNAAGFEKLLRATMARIRAAPKAAGMPVYITEIGWPTSSPSARGVSQTTQAQNLERVFDLSAELGIDTVIVYELQDGNDNLADPEGQFGISNRRSGPKPALEMIRDRK